MEQGPLRTLNFVVFAIALIAWCLRFAFPVARRRKVEKRLRRIVEEFRQGDIENLGSSESDAKRLAFLYESLSTLRDDCLYARHFYWTVEPCQFGFPTAENYLKGGEEICVTEKWGELYVGQLPKPFDVKIKAISS